MIVAKNYITVEDSDIPFFKSYFPRKSTGNEFIEFEETFEDKANRTSKYITYLGLKYKILHFLDEAKKFNDVLYNGIISNSINLYENIDILGFYYTYCIAREESITNLSIGLNQKDLTESDSILYLKIATIVNSIYYEHIYEVFGEVYPNRILTLVIHNPVVSTDLMLLEAFILSYAIGLKTNKLVRNDELNDRVKYALNSYKEKDNLFVKASFINKIYHSDLLI